MRSKDRQRPLQKIPRHQRRIVASALGVGHHHPPVRQPDAGLHRTARSGAPLQAEGRPPATELVDQVRPNGHLVRVAILGDAPATLQ